MKKLLASLCTVAILLGSVFTGIAVSANESVNFLTPSDLSGYTMGSSNSKFDIPFATATTGSYVFTAKVTLGKSLGRIYVSDASKIGYGYLISDNYVDFRQNCTGSSIGTIIRDEAKYINSTFKLEIKATLTDLDGDGADDTRFELYINDSLIRTDNIGNYTPAASSLVFMNIALNNPDPDMTDTATHSYTASDIDGYTQGFIPTSDMECSFTYSAVGNYIFTAKATVSGSLARFRIVGTSGVGYGYYLSDNYISFRLNGSTQIGTIDRPENLKILNVTFKLGVKATIVDIEGDGLDDTRMELFIDDTLMRTDYIEDFTPAANSLVFRNIGFMNVDPILSEDAAIRLEPADFKNYKQGTYGNDENIIDTTIEEEKVSKNINFVAKVTTLVDSTPEFRLAGHDGNGYGYKFSGSAIVFQYNNSGSISSYAVNKSYIGNTFKLEMKITVADTDGDGLDDAKIDLIIDANLIGTDYVKDFTSVGRLCAKNMAFVNNIDYKSEETTYITPDAFSYSLGTALDTGIDAAIKTSVVRGNFVFTAKATTKADAFSSFRIGGADGLGYDYRFNGNNIELLKNGSGTPIKTYTFDEGFVGKTFKVQYKAFVVDCDDDGFDDTLYELYIDNVLVCSDAIIDFIASAGRLIATRMSFADYVPKAKDRTEIDAGTLDASDEGFTVNDNMIPLGKNVTAECIGFNAVVKTAASNVKFRFAALNEMGYGYSFAADKVTFQKNGDGTIAEATSTKGTYLNTIFKMRVEVTSVDSNYDDVTDATNFKLYIDGDFILDNTVADYNSAEAVYCCASNIAFYKENVLTGGSSISSNIADENDTKISFSHLGLDTGRHYDGDGKCPYGSEYQGTVLNTVFEGKVMLENGGFVRYPAHRNNMNGIELRLEGTSLLIKEVDFDANGNGKDNNILVAVNSSDIGGAVIPATTFDLVVHVNTVCDADGEIWDKNHQDKPVDYIDNVVEITYYINGYKVYSLKSKGLVDYEIDDETGNVVDGSITVTGGPTLYDDFAFIYANKGEFLDFDSADSLKVKTPADYLGNMYYGEYTENKSNDAWTLGLNECFNTDLIIKEGTKVGDIIHNTLGSLKTYDDGSLYFQLLIDESEKTYRLTEAGTSFIGRRFNYKLTVKDLDYDGDGLPNDLQIGVWIDGKLCNNEYIYADDCVRKMNNQNFTIFKGVELIAPVIDSGSDDEYIVITPEDFGVALGKYTNNSGSTQYFASNRVLNHESGSINGKKFETKIKFNGADGENSYIAFGKTSESYLLIYPAAENQVRIRNRLGGTNNGANAVIEGFTTQKVHDIALTFDYISGNLKVGIYLDGEWAMDFWANGIGNNANWLTMFSMCSKTLGVGIQLGEDNIPVVCNIDDEIHIIEYIDGATYTLNGEIIEVSEEGYELLLCEPKTYTLEVVNDTYSSTKVIVAYYENDLNGDSEVNVLDYIAMVKNTMEEGFSDYIAMAAAGKTALSDVCKPKDLVLMKKILFEIA